MSDFYNKYPYTDFHELNLDWVIERVKKLTEDWLATQQEWNDTEEQWQQLHDYVMDYFDNLDVSQEINDKIDEMVSDGTFLNVIRSTVEAQTTTATENWLAAHITQPTTPAIDNTLTISGAAADAEKTGLMTALQYSSSNTYNINSYVNYNGSLYRCLQNITTPEAWTSAHWQQVRSASEIAKAFKRDQSYTAVTLDFNDLPFGWARLYLLNAAVNSPVTTPYGLALTFSDKADMSAVSQIYFDYYSQVSYIREKSNGTWTAWSKLSSAKNADIAYNNMFRFVQILTGSGVNFNSLTRGYYRIYSTTSPSNSPVSNPFGFVIVFQDSQNLSDNIFTQVYIPYSSSDSYIRYNTGGTWTAWSNFTNGGHAETAYSNMFRFVQILSGSGVDFNTLTRGYYRVYSTTSPSNSPVSNPFGFVLMFQDTQNLSQQTYTQIYLSYDKQEGYIRYCTSGTWTAWEILIAQPEYLHTVTINSGDNLYTKLRSISSRTHVIINEGTYDISTDVENSGDDNYNGDIHIKSGCWIEGRGMPKIVCTLATKKTNRSVFYFDSGSSKITGINMDITNTRYAIHDDIANNSTGTRFTHLIENCVIKYAGIASGHDYPDGLSIGGGMGAFVTSIVRNCIFTDTNDYPVYYHTNSNALNNVPIVGPSKVIIENNYMNSGTVKCEALYQDTATDRDIIEVFGNRCTSNIVISNTNGTMIPHVWNNQIDP